MSLEVVTFSMYCILSVSFFLRNLDSLFFIMPEGIRNNTCLPPTFGPKRFIRFGDWKHSKKIHESD